jgi:hypothetical protein
MRTRSIVLSTALGALIAIGLTVALGVQRAAPVGAQSAANAAAVAMNHSDEISKALDYISAQQNEDGGIPWFTADSDVRVTARGVLALVATGRPASWMTHPTSNKTMVDFLEANGVTYTHEVTGTTSIYLKPGEAGVLLTAISAANEDPTSFGGMDLIAQLNDTYNPATGAYSTTYQVANDPNQAWVILGLASAGQSVPVTATDYLKGLQADEGTWAAYGASDPDTTALAVVALIGSGNVQPDDQSVQRALDYFRNSQLSTGGWRPWWDTDPANANTTGWVIQALVAAGYTPATESWAASPNPHDALASLQQADGRIGGAYANTHSTTEALFGLTEQPLYFLGREHRALRALTWMNEQQNADGSWSGWSGPDPGAACDAALAYAAAGYDPDSVMAAGSITSAMDYLSSTASVFANKDAASAGKLALVVEAAGGDAHSSGGIDIVHILTDTWYSPTLGVFGEANNSWHQAFAMLGLAAAGEAIPVSATQTLIGLQNTDGSWTDAWGFDKPGSTGLALQALVAAGVPVADTSVVSGVLSLQNEQNAQGSWDAFGSPSPNSTAYAVQGLLAADEDLESAAWLKDGHSPYDALAAMQKVDGPFALGGIDNGLATWQAVPALLGRAYPLTDGGLAAFEGINRGPDPDRIVPATPRASLGSSVDMIVPFGSDLDRNAVVTLTWRLDAGAWQTTTLQRAEGAFTATIPTHDNGVYDLQVTFFDAGGVQGDSVVTATGAITIRQGLLPLVFRDN